MSWQNDRRCYRQPYHDINISSLVSVQFLMWADSTVTSGEVNETVNSSSDTCYPFREINFTNLTVDDVVELYHVMRNIFHCPHGDFLEGESFLNYFSPSNADSSLYLERLRSWLQRKSQYPVDFTSSVKEEVLLMRKNLYKWTKVAKRSFVRRSTRESSSGTADFLPNIDDTPVIDDFSRTKEFISLAMECRRKQRAEGIEAKDADDETAVADKTTSKKRKRKKKTSPPLSQYFDEDPSLLKPLLIFDLNKVLVWRRKKSMYFVIRPHAIEVLSNAT